jgi:hypothetical protein
LAVEVVLVVITQGPLVVLVVAEMVVMARLVVQEHQVKEAQVAPALILAVIIMLLEAEAVKVQQVEALLLMVVREALV